MFNSTLDEAVCLGKIIEIVTGNEQGELAAFKLLSQFGSAEEAIKDYSIVKMNTPKDLGLAKLFDAIHQLNVASKYNNLFQTAYPENCDQILEYFLLNTNSAPVCQVQFFYFSGTKFTQAGQLIVGTNDHAPVLVRNVFFDALENYSDGILPLVSLPSGVEYRATSIFKTIASIRDNAVSLDIKCEYEIVNYQGEKTSSRTSGFLAGSV